MRLLKSFLLGTIASTVLGQDTPVCPEGWAIGQNKCYKETISKDTIFTRSRLKAPHEIKITIF